MQRTEPQLGAEHAGSGAAEHNGVEAIVEALAHPRGRDETVAEMAHDARNMLTALGLYCDLLEEPGVLAAPYQHYGSELRLVAAASRRLVEKLVVLDGKRDRNHGGDRDRSPDRNPDRSLSRNNNQSKSRRAALSPVAPRSRGQVGGESKILDLLDRTQNRTQHLTRNRTSNWNLMPAVLIDNLAAELKANRNLLAALAGPTVTLTVHIEGSAMPVRLTGEDLTRVLVNLVKNSADAMPAGGRMAFGLHEFHSGAQQAPWLVLTVEDTGPGIPGEALDAVFGAGYTTHAFGCSANGDSSGSDSVRPSWAGGHRGLGLSITRSIVEAAGGCMHAVNPAAAGARFEIELPVRKR